MSLTPEQAFKVGFLVRCADEGLTTEETAQRIKSASLMEKVALPGILSGALSGVNSTLGILGKGLGFAGAVAPAAAITALGVPTLGGAGAGYLAAKATNPDTDELEHAKQDEIEGEYYRLAQEARRAAARKKLQARLGRKVTLLSPGLT
jgi:hypothetical protein